MCTVLVLLSFHNTVITYTVSCLYRLKNMCLTLKITFMRYFRLPLFWKVTQRQLVISYRRIGTAYPSSLQESRGPRKMLGRAG